MSNPSELEFRLDVFESPLSPTGDNAFILTPLRGALYWLGQVEKPRLTLAYYELANLDPKIERLYLMMGTPLGGGCSGITLVKRESLPADMLGD